MSDTVWTVPATVLRVVDGDTLVLKLDLGWHITYETRCRLISCNAPEMSTEEGKAAKAFAVRVLGHFGGDLNGAGGHVTFVSHALDKYGRPLGQVLLSNEQGQTADLGNELLLAGHAVPM